MTVTHDFDVLVIGSGAAGLSLALHVADHASVAVLSKNKLSSGSTSWAQGGIAAVHVSVDDGVFLTFSVQYICNSGHMYSLNDFIRKSHWILRESDGCFSDRRFSDRLRPAWPLVGRRPAATATPLYRALHLFKIANGPWLTRVLSIGYVLIQPFLAPPSHGWAPWAGSSALKLGSRLHSQPQHLILRHFNGTL